MESIAMKAARACEAIQTMLTKTFNETSFSIFFSKIRLQQSKLPINTSLFFKSLRSTYRLTVNNTVNTSYSANVNYLWVT